MKVIVDDSLDELHYVDKDDMIFYKEIVLPENIDLRKVSAKARYRNSVLTIQIIKND